jgi:hypothetical protein
MKEITKGFIGGISVGIIAGFLVWPFLGEYCTAPKKAYVKYSPEFKDLSGEKRNQIIIKTRDNSTYVLIEQEDKSYVSLEDYIESKRRATLSSSQLEIKALEQEKKEIEAAAKSVEY